MVWNDQELEALALQLDGGCGTLPPQQGRVALATFRELARGVPADPARIAERTGITVNRVLTALRAWPGVSFDRAKGVVAFWGLSLRETPYRILVGDRTLHTWCAWDALFMGGLLGEPLSIHSQCVATAAAVHIDVGRNGIETAAPPDTCVSFPRGPVGSGAVDYERNPLCVHIRFFASRAVWSEWARSYPLPLLALDTRDAWRLGRLGILRRYGFDPAG